MVPPLIVSTNRSSVIMNEVIHRDLADRVRKFLTNNRITIKEFASAIFGISKRAFDRLITKPSFNWANCKPATKERLLKLKAFFDDTNKINEFMMKFKANGNNGPFLSNNTNEVTIEDDEEDEDEEDGEEDEDDDDDEIQINTTNLNSENPIDLNELSKRIYKFLKDNQLSQRLFAQKLLGITKTHFNKLISKPQKWLNCKVVTRKHYLALVEFLNDKTRIQNFLNEVAIEKKQPILANIPTTSSAINHSRNGAVKSNYLDTLSLSRSLKALLVNNKIMNREYLLSYLGVNSVNELQNILSSPIDWSRCVSEKGCEKYRDFYLKLSNYLNSMNCNISKTVENGYEEEEDDDDDGEEEDDEEYIEDGDAYSNLDINKYQNY